MISESSSRKRLIAAAKQLFWERGFSATSPRAVLDAANVGQGSLYHFFPSKEALAASALAEFHEELRSKMRATLGNISLPPWERIAAYIAVPRDALRGCRLARFAFDPGVTVSPQLRAPLADFIGESRTALQAALDDARAIGELRADIDTAALASTVVASLHGGYVLARALDDPTAMASALAGLRMLLEAVRA